MPSSDRPVSQVLITPCYVERNALLKYFTDEGKLFSCSHLGPSLSSPCRLFPRSFPSSIVRNRCLGKQSDHCLRIESCRCVGFCSRDNTKQHSDVTRDGRGCV